MTFLGLELNNPVTKDTFMVVLEIALWIFYQRMSRIIIDFDRCII